MTTKVEGGEVALGEEVLRAAKLNEGDDVYVDVDHDGRVIVEHPEWD